MNLEKNIFTPEERDELQHTVLSTQPLAEQFENLEQQQDVASLGMWIFLGTEVMFFGVLFLGLAIYGYLYSEAFEVASRKLNWLIGGINTIVLLISSLTMVLAVHAAKSGNKKSLVRFLAITAFLGVCFLGLKGLEYYIDYQENLIPGWRFNEQEWIQQEGLSAEQIPHVKLFLAFYWIMTPLHALHITIGIGVVLVLMMMARQNQFSADNYAAVDVTGLYWHFVDIVWIFLLPMLYLLGTHHW